VQKHERELWEGGKVRVSKGCFGNWSFVGLYEGRTGRIDEIRHKDQDVLLKNAGREEIDEVAGQGGPFWLRGVSEGLEQSKNAGLQVQG
jgi:hypothetical protein